MNLLRITPRAVLAVGGLGFLLSGCAGAFLYNEDRDKTAQKAKESYDNAGLFEVVTTERTNLQGILDVELGVVQRHIDTVLEAEWFRLADSGQALKDSYLKDSIGKREMQLGVKDLGDDDRISLALIDKTFELDDDSVKDAASFIVTEFKLQPPPCDASQKRWEDGFDKIAKVAESQNKTKAFSKLKDRYQTTCNRRFDEIDPIIEQLPGGSAVRMAYEDWRAARMEFQKRQDAFDIAKEAYEKAKKLSDDAEKAKSAAEAAKLTPENFQSQVAELSGKLDDVAKAAGDLGISFVSEEHIKTIDALLVAVSSGKVDESALTTPETRQAARLAATLPSLADDAYALIKSAEAPRVAALIIEKERQSVRKEAAERRVERAERRLELLKAKLYALVLEVRLYQKIRVQHALVKKAQPDLFEKSLREALNTNNRDAKRALWLSLMHYVDSIHTARAQQEKFDYLLIALDHQEALDSTETAIGMWNALIATPINQLVAYHGSGIKSEELAALIVQLTTLGGIAVGVNR